MTHQRTAIRLVACVLLLALVVPPCTAAAAVADSTDRRLWAPRRRAQEAGPAERQAALDKFKSGAPPPKDAMDQWIKNLKNAGTRGTQPDPGANPFAAPTRKPCSPLRSTKIARTGQVNNALTGCYRGDILTFEDHGPFADPTFPLSSIDDAYRGFYFYNFAYINAPQYRESYGTSGLDVGVTGSFGIIQTTLPSDIGYTAGFFAQDPVSFKLVSLYITSLYYDNLKVAFYVNDDSYFNFTPELTLIINAGAPTLVQFPASKFTKCQFLLIEVLSTSGDVTLHPGYDSAPDSNPYFVIDNINAILP